jgi:hypothetical protein
MPPPEFIENDFPILKKAGNLSTFKPRYRDKRRNGTLLHLRDWQEAEGNDALCGLDMNTGGVGGGERGVRAISRATCTACVREAQKLLDNPAYWAEQKRLQSLRGNLASVVRRIDYLDTRSR